MKKILILLFLSFTVFSLAQQKKGTVHLEATDSKGAKKVMDAKCFVLPVIKANSTFAVILFEKEFLSDAKEIKVYMSQQQLTEPAVITIPINPENIVQSGKLAGIPYLTIKHLSQNMVLVKPTFLPDDLIMQSIKGLTQKDLEDFTTEMEKWAGY